MSTKLSIKLIALGVLLVSASAADKITPARVGHSGKIEYGRSKTIQYTGNPPYRSLQFFGKQGDAVEVKATKAKIFLTDLQYKELASGDGRVSAKLPADSTYYIVVREERSRPALILVELKGGPPPPPLVDDAAVPEYLACKVDADCVVVDRAGCCHNGYREAVNKDKVREYEKANSCKDPSVMCPMFVIQDNRAALCNTAKERCEMVKPEEIHCGGLIRNAHQCPTGYSCRVSPVPDVGGLCTKDEIR